MIGSAGTTRLCPLVASPSHLVTTWGGSGGGEGDRTRNSAGAGSGQKLHTVPGEEDKSYLLVPHIFPRDVIEELSSKVETCFLPSRLFAEESLT